MILFYNTRGKNSFGQIQVSQMQYSDVSLLKRPESTLRKRILKYDTPDRIKAQGLYPYFRVIESDQDTRVIIAGKPVLMFGSNSYLGLTNHPAIKLAAWRARHVGFVFQLYNLMPMLTAERNVELPLLLTHLSKAERRKHVEAALAVVGLTQRAKHYPRTLSGGEQQRVGIARGIVTDPTLLLCDEPTGDLDRKSGDEILQLLHALNQEHGKTIIMVTHDPHASARASRTVYLNKGRLSNEPVK